MVMQRLLCRHRHTYRERRPLHGIEVLHFVCEACGRATPAMYRTPEEYVAVADSQLPRPKARVIAPPSAAERARALDELGLRLPAKAFS